MIDDKECQKLITRLFFLRNRAKTLKTKKAIEKNKIALQLHERTCMEKFTYLITMRTSRYKSFPNYDDLNQEGYEALLKAMANYDPKKGSFFWWSHKYIDTRISRMASLHTAIRYPLAYARDHIPHKENKIPVRIEPYFNPEAIAEQNEQTQYLKRLVAALPERPRQIVSLAFGLAGEPPLSITKISKRIGIARQVCHENLAAGLEMIREKVNVEDFEQDSY